MTPHQAAQKAVEALKSCVSAWHEEDRVKAWELGRAAIAALESALQEVPREPTDEAIAAKWNELCGSKAATSWNDKVRAVIQHFSASPSTTQQPSVDHALNTTPVVDHATQQQEAGSTKRKAWEKTSWTCASATVSADGLHCPDTNRCADCPAAPSTPAREEAGVPASEPTQREKDLALLVKRLCRRLQPDDMLREGATDYLRREGLLGTPLRSPDAGVPAVGSQTNPPADADGGGE